MEWFIVVVLLLFVSYVLVVIKAYRGFVEVFRNPEFPWLMRIIGVFFAVFWIFSLGLDRQLAFRLNKERG